MNFTFAAVTMTALVALGALRPALRAQEESKTIWSGVFTDEQATRGRALYNKWCQSCHGAELSGGEMAPALAGSLFITNWDGQSVGDLEERVRITMPQGDEGALSRQAVADVLTAVFAANGAPAGTSELPKELEFLRQIRITSKK
jgi:mono/diheme cytochrome c family protein